MTCALSPSKTSAVTRTWEQVLASVLLACAGAAGAQVAPPAAVASPLYTGFQVPLVNGTLRYSASASDIVTLGFNGANQTVDYVTISGNLGYVSPSVVHPTSVTYSGGFLGGSSGQPSTFFQSLYISQSYNTKVWKYIVSDSVSYLPDTPATGLSGIPGVGDVGVVTGTDTQQGTLTPNATRVDNNASASAQRNLTGSTSLQLTGMYQLERFLGASQGIETNEYGGVGGIHHRINARSSLSANYQYNRFSYVGVDEAFTSQGVSIVYARSLTRQVSISVGAGPQYISPSALSNIPARYTYSIDSHLTYTGSVRSGTNLTVSYVRATNNGSGVTLGAETDTASVVASRRLLRSVGVSAQVNYGKNAALQQTSGLQQTLGSSLDTNGFVASVQANRALGRTFSVYASYTWERQTYAGQFQGIAPLNGVSQTLGVGLTYSPVSKHLGRN